MTKFNNLTDEKALEIYDTLCDHGFFARGLKKENIGRQLSPIGVDSYSVTVIEIFEENDEILIMYEILQIRNEHGRMCEARVESVLDLDAFIKTFGD